MGAMIKHINYYLPQCILSNSDLIKICGYTEEQIFSKTGIMNRHIAEDETALDMAVRTASNMFLNQYDSSYTDIDFIIYITQSPEYILPTTACMLQDRLDIPKTAGAIDLNMGCSGYIYGIAFAKSLINSNIAKNVLLITSETYSKYINQTDRSTLTIFGDGATATLLTNSDNECIGEFVFGTDGSGGKHFIIDKGQEHIFMNGPEIFNFTINVIPQCVNDALIKNNISMNEIDMFIFHQANKFMLDHLRSKIKIPEDKFYVNMTNVGNTVSSSIPIALKMAEDEGKIKHGDKIMLVGFGVGLSWGATIIEY